MGRTEYDEKKLSAKSCKCCKLRYTDGCACSYYAFNVETLKYELGFTQDDDNFLCSYFKEK